MSTADHGGYDIVVECPISVLSAGLTRYPWAQPPALRQPLRLGPLVCEIVILPAVTAIAGLTPADPLVPELDVTVTDAAAVIEVNGIDLGGGNIQPISVQTIPLPTTLTLRHSVEPDGLAVSMNFGSFGTGAGRLLSSSVDTSAVGSAPIVLALLVYAWFIGGDRLVQQVADALIPAIRQAMVAAALAGLEKITRQEDAGPLEPILYLLDLPRLPLPGAPDFLAGAPPPAWLDLDVTSTTIRLLVTLRSGARGNARRITRSSLVAGGPAGPGDLGMMIVSNTCLLRDIVRSRIAAAFGVPLGAFSTAGPCFVPGPAPITLTGVPPGFTISNLQAGINETGFLQVNFDFRGSVGVGTTLVGSFTQQLLPGISTVAAPGPRPLPVTVIRFDSSVPLVPIPPPVTTSRVERAWWVYLLMGLGFGPLTAALEGAADAINNAIAGGMYPATAPLSMAFTGSAASIAGPGRGGAPLPSGVWEPPVTTSTATLFQLDAVSPALPGVTTLFRDHDVIVHFR